MRRRSLDRVATVAAARKLARALSRSGFISRLCSEVAVTGTVRARAGRTAGPRGTISGAAFSSETRPAADEQRRRESDPEEWLEEIRELRRKGRIADADREWQHFSEAYPDFPVADDDLARKQPERAARCG